MNHKKFRIHPVTLLLALLAVAISTGTMQAASLLTLTPSTITLVCNSTGGPGAAVTVNVKPASAPTGTATVGVTLNTAPTGVAITPPGTTVFSVANANSSAGINYSFNAASACASFTTSSTPVSFKFKSSASGAAAQDDATLTINTILNPPSNLTASPSPVTVNCVYNSGTYTPSSAQTVSLTASAASGALTIDSSSKPAWLTLGSLSASSAPATFTAVATAGCGGFALNSSNTANVHIQHATATAMTDKVIPITLKIVSASTLTLAPTSIALTYAKGSGTPGFKDVIVSASSGAPFFTVDTASLPIWLTVDSMTGTTPKSLRFSSTSVADSLAPGSYSGSVRIKVTGQDDKVLPVTLQVNNPAAKLSVSEGQTRNYSWTVGQTVPSYYVTLVSSGSAIPYTITTGGPLSPTISNAQLLSGLAYSFGTAIPVSFPPEVFAAAQAGSTLTGTVSITWGSPSATTVVTFNISVLSPGATLTSITPAALPTGSPGTTQTVFLTGTGFIPSTDPNQKTRVGLWINSAFVAHSSLSANVINASNIALTITVPAATDTQLPFANGGSVTLAVCNPVGATCPVGAGATQSFSIGANPTVQLVTSASGFVQVSPGQNQNVAPYDMLSIFGFNFCAGCSSSTVLYGAPDPVSLRYPTILAPNANAPTVGVKVGFYAHGTTSSPIAYAPLLFATNNQINFLVPEGVSASIGSTVDIIVSYDTRNSSAAPTVVNVVDTNPGVFTIGADGQGDGAILDPANAVVGVSNPAAARKTLANSDIVSIFMTGLGSPDSALSGSGWEVNCIAATTYKNSLNSSTGLSLADLNGDIIQSALIASGKLAPCIKSDSSIVPTVTIGGVSAPVKYAGWVADSIAGLYQVNVQLPSTNNTFTKPDSTTISAITAPVQLPLVVTSNSVTSQPGVTIWVAPRLKVLAPTALTGKVGASWPSSNNSVVASDSAAGSPSYTYQVTGGTLPSGLSLNTSTGAITGTPALYTVGSYPITVTATDNATTPVTGSRSFTLVVNAGLVTSSSAGASITVAQPGSGTAAVTTVSVTGGGSGTYTYAITSGSPPSGLAVDASGNVTITSTTPKATTNGIVVTITDTVTNLTGDVTFNLTVN